MSCTDWCSVARRCLEDCTGVIRDASAATVHQISRLIDAHEHMWDSFARHLKLDEDFIVENYLFANGGGSPSRRFMVALLEQRPNIEVMHFQGLLKNSDMEDISEVSNDENADEFMEYIHWRTQDRVYIHLNTPKENPRWKIVAGTYGFSTEEIENFEIAVEMYNLYSPTSRILTAYRQRFSRDSFDKIVNSLAKWCQIR